MARIAGVNVPENKHLELALHHIYGVGRKTAERLVLDMRDKVDQIFPDSSRDNQNSDSTEVDDAIAALVSLGYRKVDAEKYVDSLGEEFSSSEEIIRQVLKNVLVR